MQVISLDIIKCVVVFPHNTSDGDNYYDDDVYDNDDDDDDDDNDFLSDVSWSRLTTQMSSGSSPPEPGLGPTYQVKINISICRYNYK